MRGYGANLMQGLIDGIDGEMPTLDRAVGRINGSLNVKTQPSTAYDAMGLMAPTPQQTRDITVILEMDGIQFGKAVYRANNEETQRVGVRLAGGYA